MGNDASKTATAATAANRNKNMQQLLQQQQAVNDDLEYLSDRFPFENVELEMLYHQYYLNYYFHYCHPPPKESSSLDNNDNDDDDEQTSSYNSFLFAYYWAQHDRDDDNDNNNNNKEEEEDQKMVSILGLLRDSKEFQKRLHIVEQEILPPHFGKQLELVAFLRPADREIKETAASSTTTSTTTFCHDDDNNNTEEAFCVRQERMEAFFEGLANCGGRRGSRAALGTLFQLCVVSPWEQRDSDDDDEDNNNNKNNTISNKNNKVCRHPANSKNLVDADGNEIKAKVMDVLDLAYRLAIAIEFLRAKHSEEQELDDDVSKALLPQTDADAAPPKMNKPATAATTTALLEPLARSCLDYVHQQRARRSVVIETMDDSDLEQGYCSKMDFLEWSEATLPLLSSILPTFLHTIWFPHQPFPPSLTCPFSFPRLNDESAIMSSNNNNNNMNKDYTSDSSPCTPTLFSLVCMSKSLVGHWHCLYTSNSDGMSFNRLHNALLGYSGPTLLLIQAAATTAAAADDDDDDTNSSGGGGGAIFGAFTGSNNKWKDSNEYYGNDTVFLYQLSPEPAVFRPRGGGRRDANYMYCNCSSSASCGVSKSRRGGGIAFGGDLPTRSPRLFLDESFSGCYVSSHDTTFEPGHLLPRTDEFSQKTFFNIDQLEVWGCSGEDATMAAKALEEREQDRAVREAHIRNARTVMDKTAFLGDLRTGLIESKAFTHVDQIHGSTRFHILNRNKKGYR